MSTQKIAENNVKAFCWKKDAIPRWTTLILTKCDECYFICPNKDLKNHTKTLHRNCREDCVKAFYWEGAFQSTGDGGTTFIPRSTIYCIVYIVIVLYCINTTDASYYSKKLKTTLRCIVQYTVCSRWNVFHLAGN